MASETTEADTICDSEEEESPENGKHNRYSNCKVLGFFDCILHNLPLIPFPSCPIPMLFPFFSICVREYYDLYSSPLQMRLLVL